MQHYSSIAVFSNLLQEKLQAIKVNTTNLMNLLAQNNQAEKENSAKILLKNCEELLSVLSEKDKPNWLLNLRINVNNYTLSSSGKKNVELLNTLLTLLPEISNFVFNFDSDYCGIDIDRIYNEYKQASKLNQLFDSLVDLLSKLLNDEALDSKKISAKLNDLVSLIKKQKNSSYLSFLVNWDYINKLLNNIIKENLKSIPIIGPTIEAIIKTLDEANIEIEKMNQNIHDDVKKGFDFEMGRLNSRPSNLITE